MWIVRSEKIRGNDMKIFKWVPLVLFLVIGFIPAAIICVAKGKWPSWYNVNVQ